MYIRYFVFFSPFNHHFCSLYMWRIQCLTKELWNYSTEKKGKTVEIFECWFVEYVAIFFYFELFLSVCLSLWTYIHTLASLALSLCIHMKWAAPLRLIFMIHKNNFCFCCCCWTIFFYSLASNVKQILFFALFVSDSAQELSFVIWIFCHFAYNKNRTYAQCTQFHSEAVPIIFCSENPFPHFIMPKHTLATNKNPHVNGSLSLSSLLIHSCLPPCFLAHIHNFGFCSVPRCSVIIRHMKVCYFMKSVKMKNVTNRIWITRRSGRAKL